MAVVSKMNFDEEYWQCGPALVNMFFSDWEDVRTDLAFREALATELKWALDDPTGRRSNKVVPPPRLGAFNRFVENVITYSPTLTGELQLAPMVWMKMAIQLSSSDSPIAKSFIRRYGAWRDKQQKQGVSVLIEKIERNDKSSKLGSLPKIENSSLTGYPLDVFLLTVIDEYISQEFTLKLKYIKINDDVNNAGNIIGNTRSMQGPKKSKKDNIGSNVYSDIVRLVELAAEGELIKGELYRKINGRYCYSGYRQDLLVDLRRLFPDELKCKDEGYKKAISKIVIRNRKKH